MVTVEIVGPFPPFDYGMAVRWVGEDDQAHIGSIFGFRKLRANHLSDADEFNDIVAQIEDKSGNTQEVPLSRLTIL